MPMSANFSHNLDVMPLMDLSSAFIADLDEPTNMHKGTDIFQNASEDMSRLFNILECAENVLSMENPARDMEMFDFSLEPTPIGPSGIQRVVTMQEIMPPSSVTSLMEIFQPTSAFRSGMELNMRPPKRQRMLCKAATPFPQKDTRNFPQSIEEAAQMSEVAPAIEQSFDDTDIHFRSYQSDQWLERFQDLVEFKVKHGHCLVPHNYPPNQQLAQWTKRQVSKFYSIDGSTVMPSYWRRSNLISPSFRFTALSIQAEEVGPTFHIDGRSRERP